MDRYKVLPVPYSDLDTFCANLEETLNQFEASGRKPTILSTPQGVAVVAHTSDDTPHAPEDMTVEDASLLGDLLTLAAATEDQERQVRLCALLSQRPSQQLQLFRDEVQALAEDQHARECWGIDDDELQCITALDEAISLVFARRAA